MRLIPALILLLALAACSDRPDVKSTVARREDRIKRAEVTLARPPDTRTINVGNNQLLVVEIPVADNFGFVDTQRCFVWRDAEYKSASFQCPSDSNAGAPLTGPEDDKSRY
jgi:hypothetical protein